MGALVCQCVGKLKEYRYVESTLHYSSCNTVGRVERRRDRFRPMASFVSALSSIVANSPRVMPKFPPPPLFIPYGGFSPVRLEASLVLLRPSETFRGFVLRRSCRSSLPGPFVSRRLER